MFPSGSARSFWRSPRGEEGLCTSVNKGCKIPKTFTSYLSLSLSLSFSLFRSFAHSTPTLDLKGCSCKGKKTGGKRVKKERERKRREGKLFFYQRWRELALCPMKIVSGTREKAHNVCKRLVGPDCRPPLPGVNSRWISIDVGIPTERAQLTSLRRKESGGFARSRAFSFHMRFTRVLCIGCCDYFDKIKGFIYLTARGAVRRLIKCID